METAEKVWENRLRRKLDRMGYRLVKNRMPGPRAGKYPGYMIFDPWNNRVVAGSKAALLSLSLSDVETFTEQNGPNRRKPN